MGLTRQLVRVTGLLGLGAVVAVTLARGASLRLPGAERVGLDSIASAGRHDGGWQGYLEVVDRELAQGHVDVAVRVWQDAYGAALASRSWAGMIAVGDAFVAIGRASGTPSSVRMNAREAYVTALIRARRERSVDGALRAAEAFRRLGEGVLTEQGLRIAAQLAAGDEQAQQRVREARNLGHEPWPVNP
jgi:hypothetical protein